MWRPALLHCYNKTKPETGMGRVARFTPHRAATHDASNGEKAAG